MKNNTNKLDHTGSRRPLNLNSSIILQQITPVKLSGYIVMYKVYKSALLLIKLVTLAFKNHDSKINSCE